jgi:hypothetical protein
VTVETANFLRTTKSKENKEVVVPEEKSPKN